MPDVVIHAIDCQSAATGMDREVLEALARSVAAAADVGAASAAFLGPTGAAVGAALQAAKEVVGVIPGLVAAIDEARADPDQLYLNLSNQERDRKIWPITGDVVEINSGQIVRPNLRVPFSEVVDINFWEWDGGSDDDFLGRLTVDLSHAGGVRYQVVSNPAEGNIYVVAYSVDGVASGPAPEPEQPSTTPGVLYAVERVALDPATGRRGGGRLLWFHHDGAPGPLSAASGAPVGRSWEFAHIASGGDGVIYAVTEDGRLLWYRHDGHDEGTFAWAPRSSNEIGSGWNHPHVFAGEDGTIYTVSSAGELRWHRHLGRLDGSPDWAEPNGVTVGTGWDFAHVFAGSGGVIYAIERLALDPRTGRRTGGRLLWYRHDGHRDGQPSWAGGGSPRPVGRHWDFTHVTAGRDGAIYAVTEDGRLLWYQHDGRHDGTETWAAGAGREIASGWSYAHVFAG